MFKFELENQKGEKFNQWSFSEDKNKMIIIGRSPACDISVKHFSISGEQMLVHFLKNGQISVVDLAGNATIFVDFQTEPIIRNQIILLKNKAKFYFEESDLVLKFSYKSKLQIFLKAISVFPRSKKENSKAKDFVNCSKEIDKEEALEINFGHNEKENNEERNKTEILKISVDE